MTDGLIKYYTAHLTCVGAVSGGGGGGGGGGSSSCSSPCGSSVRSSNNR